MEITEVKVFPVGEEKLKAFVSVVFDRCFMVNDIKIIQGRQGLFMSMPSRKKKNGEFKDVAHPLNNGTRQRIEGQVLAEYERVLEERDGEPIRHRRRSRTRKQQGKQMPADVGTAAVVAEGRPETTAGEDGTRHPAGQAAGREPGRDSEETREDSGTETAAAGRPDAETACVDSPAAQEKTLEEVEEMHLRDSFWTVP